ncbi:hypothetical protein [Methylophaga thiooxydans]|uniref:Uncharacterized protein n=1 Tax=Methylophaga thiooxydans DMS010 TaxID=637616 RepID=C0N345_9GAMM|nr:hypothetical protein [Methylophaga thiooxydans]EEF80858.1 hypothetical protein MDMS009_585 [Methylophaga thiooxydans DMS010]
MKYFKDENNNVFAFESDGSQDHLIKSGMTEIDESEIQSVIDSKLIIDDRLANKHSEIVQKFKLAMAPVTSLYTAEEIASFPTQEPEAIAWQSDNAAPTPLIDFIVAERASVDKATLVGRIISNASNYKSVAGPAIGKKQDYEDLLYALQTQHEDEQQPDVIQADIDAIVVDYR